MRRPQETLYIIGDEVIELMSNRNCLHFKMCIYLCETSADGEMRGIKHIQCLVSAHNNVNMFMRNVLITEINAEINQHVNKLLQVLCFSKSLMHWLIVHL